MRNIVGKYNPKAYGNELMLRVLQVLALHDDYLHKQWVAHSSLLLA
jgi:hypothetical protein